MKVGALTESARREKVATKRWPVFERPVIDTVLDAPVPWLLTLIPVGSLVVAGLLTAMLAWFATPTVKPSEPSTEEAPDLGLPMTDEVECDGWIWRVGPTYTR
jgi:hypothetical protein